jgi:hypothetical protein
MTEAYIPWPTGPEPAVAQSITQAGYTTSLTKVSTNFHRNNYSRVPAFNFNNTKQLLARLDGFWSWINTAPGSTQLNQISGMAGDCEPYWHPAKQDELFHVGAFGLGFKLVQLNVVTGVNVKEWDLESRILAVFPTAAKMRTANEGAPSADTRYWAWGIEDSSGAMLGLLTFDRKLDQVLATKKLRKKPNWVSISPTGKFVMIGADYTPINTKVYDARTLTFIRDLGTVPDHGDMMLGADGRDYWVTIFQGPQLDGQLSAFDIETGVGTPILNTYVNQGATALHVSGKAYAKPGWVCVSTYGERNDGDGVLTEEWFYRQVWMQEVFGQQRVIRLANTQATVNRYEDEPHASVSYDGKLVAFNSNWESPTQEYAAPYRISGYSYPQE